MPNDERRGRKVNLYVDRKVHGNGVCLARAKTEPKPTWIETTAREIVAQILCWVDWPMDSRECEEATRLITAFAALVLDKQRNEVIEMCAMAVDEAFKRNMSGEDWHSRAMNCVRALKGECE